MAIASRNALKPIWIVRATAALLFCAAGCGALPAAATETHALGDLPLFLVSNLGDDPHGGEAGGALRLTPRWRLNVGVSALEKGLKVDPWRVDPMRTPYAGQDRRYRALLRSLVNLGDRVEFDVGVRAVGRANSFNVPAYADADVRIGYHLTTALDLSLSGFSLLHNSHMEAIDPSSAPVVPVQRAVLLSLRWRR